MTFGSTTSTLSSTATVDTRVEYNWQNVKNVNKHVKQKEIRNNLLFILLKKELTINCCNKQLYFNSCFSFFSSLFSFVLLCRLYHESALAVQSFSSHGSSLACIFSASVLISSFNLSLSSLLLKFITANWLRSSVKIYLPPHPSTYT